jgi:hypothetical protein
MTLSHTLQALVWNRITSAILSETPDLPAWLRDMAKSPNDPTRNYEGQNELAIMRANRAK